MKKCLTNTENNIQVFSISNRIITVEVLNYGGIIHSIKVNKNGKVFDVVLGYKNLTDYLCDDNYFGAIVGRVCNVVKDAKYTLNDKQYNLIKNQNQDSLHGGSKGLTKRFWQVENHTDSSLTLTTFSHDGEDGYGGNLTVKAVYSFTNRGGLLVELFAISDKETPIALTMHPYFNLNGEGAGFIGNHLLEIDADFITLTDNDYACTGELLNVKNTPYDFKRPKPIGKNLNADFPQMIKDGGYDVNFVLNSNAKIKAIGDLSGVSLEIFTNQNGAQLYTSNSLNVKSGKSCEYKDWQAFCIEPQNYPNAVNISSFPTPFVKANENYYWQTEYLFK